MGSRVLEKIFQHCFHKRNASYSYKLFNYKNSTCVFYKIRKYMQAKIQNKK